MVWVGLSAAAGTVASEPVLETVASAWAMPYQVHLEHVGDGAEVSGRLLAWSVNPGRRLYGQVCAEILDRHGEVIAVYHGDPRRMSPARHTRRARFVIGIERMPGDAEVVRVSYR